MAFASEGGVAAQSMIPKYVYYGAWALSGTAVVADIATKTMDAPEDKRLRTAGYHTAFHIPASIVLPAVIIHKIVHQTEHVVKSNKSLSQLGVKTQRVIPVAVAIASIAVVVPVVDHLCEWAMEPTLGRALGLEFDHHHHSDHHEKKKKD
ncbi:mitochondrial fission process 1 family protein [bacterium]|nr:mitochondrial fission process 1 family protein [bacterium]